MKKVVRTVWISALSGLAFLTACCTQNGLTRRERKQLVKEREEIMVELDRNRSYDMEGPLENFLGHKDNIYALENKLDSINFRLGDSIDLDRNFRRRQILRRIDSLNYLIENYSPPCIYGSPEMMEQKAGQIDMEYKRLVDELREAEQNLLEFDILGLPVKSKEGRAADVLYGSPDVRRRVKK